MLRGELYRYDDPELTADHERPAARRATRHDH
jgi:hypothetical protein